MATILSAQCTDARVNLVTPELFRRCPGPGATPRADEGELAERDLRHRLPQPEGALDHGTAAAGRSSHRGEVPRTIEKLVTLPGVGRKTAAVVLGNAFGRNEGIAVDTHVGRIVRRLGFTGETDPVKVERVLLGLVPRRRLDRLHAPPDRPRPRGCTARAPQCDDCVLLSLCPEGQRRVGWPVSRSGSRPRSRPGRPAATALPPPPRSRP